MLSRGRRVHGAAVVAMVQSWVGAVPVLRGGAAGLGQRALMAGILGWAVFMGMAGFERGRMNETKPSRRYIGAGAQLRVRAVARVTLLLAARSL